MNKNIKQKARPFVKWAGGKTRVVPLMLDFFPEEFNRYYEPFLGGGALYFSISPQNGCLNDINCVLIEAYLHIRDDLEGIIKDLNKIQRIYYSLDGIESKSKFYYEQREKFNSLNKTSLHRSALFIFLNKTGYNGMYRENASGKFNIPFGKRLKPIICDSDNLTQVSNVLKQIDIKCGSYDKALKEAKSGDFIYFDPPYEPLNRTSSFTEYQAGGFVQDDQRKLSKVFKKLSDKGCKVMMSNSTADLVYELYDEYFINKISVSRGINATKSKRDKIEELIITNYEPVRGAYTKAQQRLNDDR
ncbi:MAG: adenine methylase [Patescibacteria group bacterium]|nr:adenine methylase [Patescibacteria group bacterium]